MGNRFATKRTERNPRFCDQASGSLAVVLVRCTVCQNSALRYWNRHVKYVLLANTYSDHQCSHFGAPKALKSLPVLFSSQLIFAKSLFKWTGAC
jgi:hypothetical protein